MSSATVQLFLITWFRWAANYFSYISLCYTCRKNNLGFQHVLSPKILLKFIGNLEGRKQCLASDLRSRDHVVKFIRVCVKSNLARVIIQTSETDSHILGLRSLRKQQFLLFDQKVSKNNIKINEMFVQ